MQTRRRSRPHFDAHFASFFRCPRTARTGAHGGGVRLQAMRCMGWRDVARTTHHFLKFEEKMHESCFPNSPSQDRRRRPFSEKSFYFARARRASVHEAMRYMGWRRTGCRACAVRLPCWLRFVYRGPKRSNFILPLPTHIYKGVALCL